MKNIDQIIEYLQKSRVLKKVDDKVELLHDGLAKAIAQKRTPEDIARDHALNIIRNAYHAYVNINANQLMGKEQLAFVQNYLEYLPLSKEEKDFINLSQDHINRKLKEEKKKQFILRTLTIGIITITIIAFAISQWLFSQATQARIKAQKAEVKFQQTSKNTLALEYLNKGDITKAIRICERIYDTYYPDINLSTQSTLAKIYYQHIDEKLLFYKYNLPHNDYVRWVDYSPDGKAILTATPDGKVTLWNKQAQEMPWQIPQIEESDNIRFASDTNNIIVNGYLEGTRAWNFKGEEVDYISSPKEWGGLAKDVHQFLLESTSPQIRGVTGLYEVSDRSRTIIAAFNDYKIKLWNDSFYTIGVMSGHQDQILDLAFSPDGNRMISTSKDQTAKIWEYQKPTLKALRGSNRISTVAIAENQTYLTGSWEGVLTLWNEQADSLWTCQAHEDKIVASLFSPDEKHILSISQDGFFKLWNLNGKLLGEMILEEEIYQVNYLDTDSLFILSDQRAALINLKGATIWEIKGDNFRAADISLENQRVALVLEDTLCIYDFAQELLWKKRVHQAQINALALSPDGESLISGSSDPQIFFWNVKDASYKEIGGEINKPKAEITSIAYSPDGNGFATAYASGDPSIILWNAEGKFIKKLAYHEVAINALLYSPDGNYVLSGSSDGTAIFHLTPQGIYTFLKSPEASHIYRLMEEEKKEVDNY